MDFINKAIESLSTVGKEVSQKATDVSAIAKATLQMKEKEKQLQNTLKALGTVLYTQKKEVAEELFPELTELIQILDEELTELKEHVAALKGKKTCPGCGKDVTDDAKFCSNCGAEMPAAKATEVVDVEVAEAEESVVEEIIDEIKDVAEEIKEEITE
jgi:DNA repair exonuclease SbcCD ATPase subunit